jgi:hypothetical protein
VEEEREEERVVPHRVDHGAPVRGAIGAFRRVLAEFKVRKTLYRLRER